MTRATPRAPIALPFPDAQWREDLHHAEELDVDYEVHRVRFTDEDVKSDAFLSLNPNNKIPAIIDPNGPDDQPLGLFDSGAILLCLAEKYGKLLGNSSAEWLKITQ